MRSMKNTWSFQGRTQTFYESSFDPETGTLVRRVLEGRESRYAYASPFLQAVFGRPHSSGSDRELSRWRELYNRRGEAFSPVPETIDVKVTGKCGFGCQYCYMDSTPGEAHPEDPLAVVDAIFDQLDQPPYQMAYGGGEPCGLPEFPELLRLTASRGAVPNFTTAGHIQRKEVADAVQEVCGGVALTYHRFRGIDAFLRRFVWWDEVMGHEKMLNIHVLADKDVVASINELLDAGITRCNMVLLAYYPEVGRSKWRNIMAHETFMKTLPEAIQRASDAGMRISVSEGMLPWMLSRPELPLVSEFAGPQEGRFSCYVNEKGQVSASSFSPPRATQLSILDYDDNPAASMQQQWNKLYVPYEHKEAVCRKCDKRFQCSAPQAVHRFVCAYQEHNK